MNNTKYNYIYDIYLNLNKKLYDFFDWNKSDKLVHIKKIPIIKIKKENMKKLIENKINISNDFLNSLFRKTEYWNKKHNIDYCAIFVDKENAIAIEFNKYGDSIKKSYLSINDELDILEIANKMNEKNIKFKFIRKENFILKTRNQIKLENFINTELKNTNDNKLKYIYLECFGEKENDKKYILNRINKIPKDSKTYKTLYDILKLTSISKK